MIKSKCPKFSKFPNQCTYSDTNFKTILFRLNEYEDTIEEAFETLNEVMKEIIELKEYISDIDPNFLSSENQNPRDGTYPTSNHKSDYGDIIRLSKK